MEIVQVTQDNLKDFNKIVSGNSIILFHHPQCGHCQDLKPTWDKMKQLNSNNGIKIIEIEAQALSNLQHPLKQHVRGFPQILKLHNGNVVDEFNKERTLSNLNSFINSPMNSLPLIRNQLNKKKTRDKKTN